MTSKMKREPPLLYFRPRPGAVTPNFFGFSEAYKNFWDLYLKGGFEHIP